MAKLTTVDITKLIVAMIDNGYSIERCDRTCIRWFSPDKKQSINISGSGTYAIVPPNHHDARGIVESVIGKCHYHNAKGKENWHRWGTKAGDK